MQYRFKRHVFFGQKKVESGAIMDSADFPEGSVAGLLRSGWIEPVQPEAKIEPPKQTEPQKPAPKK